MIPFRSHSRSIKDSTIRRRILIISSHNLGKHLEAENSNLVEIRHVYDTYNDPTKECYIDQPNANKTCVVEMNVGPVDLEPPVLIHYEIKNFYQNHRKYLFSVDWSQLHGKGESSLGQKNCLPLTSLGGISLNPCGLIANTFFNDVISLTNPSQYYMNETGIAWSSDMDKKFQQPLGFKKYQCSSCNDAECTCTSTTGGGPWSCKEPYQDNQGQCWLYYYPNEDTTQYLYEVSMISLHYFIFPYSSSRSLLRFPCGA